MNNILNPWNHVTGKYKLTCECCESDFYGRKNQQYCNPKCKSKIANDKASLKNAIAKDVNETRNNCFILYKLYKIKNITSFYELQKMIFNSKAASKNIKMDKYDGAIKSFGDYGIFPLNTELIEFEIVKIRNNE